MLSFLNDLHSHLNHPTPVKWCSLFVVGKQMYQTIAVKSRHLYITPSWSAFHCYALRVGEAKFVTLLAISKLPSATFHSAFLRSIHYCLSAPHACCSKTWHAFSPAPRTLNMSKGAHIFRKAIPGCQACVHFSSPASLKQASGSRCMNNSVLKTE